MDKELYLTDLISVEVLQRIQDTFSSVSGMAALTTDSEGVPVTQGSNFTEFCMKYSRNSEVGKSRCEQCDKLGAQTTWESGKPTTYYCHAGLIDYAAPIVADNHLLGCFIGGQVLTKTPEYAQIKELADVLEVDAEQLYEAAKNVTVMDKEDIDHSAQFLYTVAGALSDMAYGKYLALQANKEMERAVNMQSDFLANMSHEIRTPMNAVIGMAEMALRENLPPVAREYVQQIKSSSKALLTIINDILDFSKIESGKMDIIPVDYEPLSIVNDVSNIFVTRLKDKKVELILDISPDIPRVLYGDNIRINQVLLNLANNALKFTNEGHVAIRMWHTPLNEEEIMLHVAVEDTGIGIKEQDMGKLFRSFQQVDSKRNRNIEGTGLGLAISRKLVQMMQGDLHVESEYEKGSTFSFYLPQKIVNQDKGIQVENASDIVALSFLQTPVIRRQLQKDCDYFGVAYKELSLIEDIKAIGRDKTPFLFIEQSQFSDVVEELTLKQPHLTTVVLMDYHEEKQYKDSNLLLVKKPLFTLNESQIFNHESLHYHSIDSETVTIDFIAPEAEVLIVDDNAVNLTVAVGLMEPLKMKVDTALSGEEAIGKISEHHYDIVLMDHMMPELDGIETTHIIRRFHKEYDDVPIIALTANAMDGVKGLFLQEGMNDFIAKPIELKILLVKIRKWLPPEKIEQIEASELHKPESGAATSLTIGDLDTAEALKRLGSERLYWSVLKDYYRVIDKKAAYIESLMKEENWSAYTIEVHALKSSSKQIGANSLAEKAAAMEAAGNAQNEKQIRICTEEMLRQYRSYLSVLKPYFESDSNTPKKEVKADKLKPLFRSMRDALDNLDIDHMELVIEQMEEYHYEDWREIVFDQLKDAVADVDVERCDAILNEWESREDG